MTISLVPYADDGPLARAVLQRRANGRQPGEAVKPKGEWEAELKAARLQDWQNAQRARVD